MYAPLSGTVVEVNALLGDAPELVNQEPYGQGWMIVIEPSDLSGFEKLLSAEEYRRFTEKESGQTG